MNYLLVPVASPESFIRASVAIAAAFPDLKWFEATNVITADGVDLSVMWSTNGPSVAAVAAVLDSFKVRTDADLVAYTRSVGTATARELATRLAKMA